MKKTLFIPPQKTPYFSLPAHRITWEQDLSHLKKGLSQKEMQLFLDLYTRAQENPKKVKKETQDFLCNHPGHPEILNLLSFICLQTRDTKQANRLIRENYTKNPQYLFARINYAQLCLTRKQGQKIPDIFNKKYNLPNLYPGKTTFHVSEFRGFMVVMGLYYLTLGKRQTAEGYHYLAYRVDPNHPNTKSLEKKLYHKKPHKLLMPIILKKLFQLTNRVKMG